jgi:hypothetical protein
VYYKLPIIINVHKANWVTSCTSHLIQRDISYGEVNTQTLTRVCCGGVLIVKGKKKDKIYRRTLYNDEPCLTTLLSMCHFLRLNCKADPKRYRKITPKITPKIGKVISKRTAYLFLTNKRRNLFHQTKDLSITL